MYLLDTCTFLWYMREPAKLSAKVLEILENRNNEIFVSSISAWEINQKYKLGNLDLKISPPEFFAKYQAYYSIKNLSFDIEAANIYHKLPDIHRDPFDKMLVCQTIANSLTLVTKDADIQKYPIKTIW